MTHANASLEATRERLLADAATQGIAKTLGVPVEAYVEKVLDYVQHPQKQPTFEVVPDGVARAAGTATTVEVKQWLEDVAAGKVELRGEREVDRFEG